MFFGEDLFEEKVLPEPLSKTFLYRERKLSIYESFE